MKFNVNSTKNKKVLSFSITYEKFSDLYNYYKSGVLKESIFEIINFLPFDYINEEELAKIKKYINDYDNFSKFSKSSVALNNNLQYAFEKLNKVLVDDIDFYNISAKKYDNEVKLVGRICCICDRPIISVNGLYAEFFNDKSPFYVYYGGDISHVSLTTKRYIRLKYLLCD